MDSLSPSRANEKEFRGPDRALFARLGSVIVFCSSEAALDRLRINKLRQAPPLQGAGVAPRREAPGRAAGGIQKGCVRSDSGE